MLPPRTLFLSRGDRFLSGSRRRVVIPAPAAGIDWSVAVEGGNMWRPLCALMVLSTSAAVGNRNIGVQITDTDTAVWRTRSSVNVAASAAQAVALSASESPGQASAGDLVLGLLLPRIWLQQGWTLAASTGGLLAGDQWAAFTLWVEEAREPTDNIPAGGTVLEELLEAADTRWLREIRP